MDAFAVLSRCYTWYAFYDASRHILEVRRYFYEASKASQKKRFIHFTGFVKSHGLVTGRLCSHQADRLEAPASGGKTKRGRERPSGKMKRDEERRTTPSSRSFSVMNMYPPDPKSYETQPIFTVRLDISCLMKENQNRSYVKKN